MSKLRTLAELIPADYRREILATDMIASAYASKESNNMMYLSTIYKEYIEPDFDGSCALCLSRALNVFKQLQPELVKLQKEQNLLDL